MSICLGRPLRPLQLSQSAAQRRPRRLVVPARAEGAGASPPPLPPEQQQAPPPRPPPPNPLTDPAATVVWGGTLPSPRRAVLGLGGALAIALVGNLGGVTSGLLALDGGRLAASLQIDALYPVRGLKRCIDQQHGFTFLYPSSWLADQRLLMRNVDRAERSRSLDPPPLRQQAPVDPMAPRSSGALAAQQQQQRRRQAQYEPVAAFGPPGSDGSTNVSVIVAPIEQSFSLEMMGPPAEAAEALLAATVAPPGSGRVATVLEASSRRDEQGQLYYTAEFTVKGPSFFRHNVFTFSAREGRLYTLDVIAPEEDWSLLAASARATSDSFRMLAAPSAAAPPPTRPAA